MSWLVVQQCLGGGQDEDAPAVARAAQRLAAHQRWAGEAAAGLAAALGLEAADRAMLVAAARHHDDGKAADRWQRAFGAPSDWRAGGPYAKTAGPVSHHRLNGSARGAAADFGVRESRTVAFEPERARADAAKKT